MRSMWRLGEGRVPAQFVFAACSAFVLCAAGLVLNIGGGGRRAELEGGSGRRKGEGESPGYPRTPIGFWQRPIRGARSSLSLGGGCVCGSFSLESAWVSVDPTFALCFAMYYGTRMLGFDGFTGARMRSIQLCCTFCVASRLALLLQSFVEIPEFSSRVRVDLALVDGHVHTYVV